MSITFDSATDRISIGNLHLPDARGTLFGWFKPNNAPDDDAEHVYFEYVNNSNMVWVLKKKADNKAEAGWWISGSLSTMVSSGTAPFLEDTWNSFVLTYQYNPDNDKLKQELWINRMSVLTQTDDLASFASNVGIAYLGNHFPAWGDLNANAKLARYVYHKNIVWTEADIIKFHEGRIPHDGKFWLEGRKDYRDHYHGSTHAAGGTTIDTGDHPPTLLYRESDDGIVVEVADYYGDAILAAVNHAYTSRRAREVYMPGSPLPYLLETTLVLTHIGYLRIHGCAKKDIGGWNRSAGTWIKWAGSQGGTMIRANIYGVEFDHFTVDGNAYSDFFTTPTNAEAAKGLVLWSDTGFGAGFNFGHDVSFINFKHDINHVCLQFNEGASTHNVDQSEYHRFGFSTFGTAVKSVSDQCVSNRFLDTTFFRGLRCFHIERGTLNYLSGSVLHCDLLAKIDHGGINYDPIVFQNIKVEPWAVTQRRTRLLDTTDVTGSRIIVMNNVHTGLQGQASDYQYIIITGSPTGGTFKLSVNGQTTANITFSTPENTGVAIENALEALSSVGSEGVSVVPNENTFRVLFSTGAHAGVLSVAENNLSGGTDPDITIDAKADADATIFDLGEKSHVITYNCHFVETDSGWPLKRGMGKWDIYQDKFASNIKLNPILPKTERGRLIQGPWPLGYISM